MRNHIILISLFGMTSFLAACGSDETSCANDAEVSAAPSREQEKDDPVCTHDTWENYGQQFFADNCVQCHKNFQNYDRIKARHTRMMEMIESDRMPKTGPLPADEKDRILTYLACGAPE